MSVLRPLRERFEEKVDRRGPDECWPWIASSGNGSGHGQIRIADGVIAWAHRLAWEFAIGPIPDGLHVLHHCDNPPCCNPAHLFLGTQADNVADMHRKGRARKAVGERSAGAKLTDALVREIRCRSSQGQSMRSIGREFGIHHSAVSDIVSRRTWRHVA